MSNLPHDLRQNITAEAFEVMENFEHLEDRLDAIPVDAFAEDPSTSVFPVWGHVGGLVRSGGTVNIVAAGTVALDASATNYVEVNGASGVVDANAVSFTGGEWIPLRVVTCDAGTILTSVDKRTPYAGANGAYYLARANHTGTQPASTISDFTEACQDVIGSTLLAGSNISVNYDDALNTFTITNGAPLTTEAVQDIVGAMAVSGTNATATYDDGAGTLTFSAGGDALTTEAVQDIVAALLTAGTNVTITYNDGAGTLTVTAAGGSAAAPGTFLIGAQPDWSTTNYRTTSFSADSSLLAGTGASNRRAYFVEVTNTDGANKQLDLDVLNDYTISPSLTYDPVFTPSQTRLLTFLYNSASGGTFCLVSDVELNW